MNGPCPYPCDNKNLFGYCLCTGCVNPHYQHEVFLDRNDIIPNPCRNCPNHPMNGGSGICHCILGTQTIY